MAARPATLRFRGTSWISCSRHRPKFSSARSPFFHCSSVATSALAPRAAAALSQAEPRPQQARLAKVAAEASRAHRLCAKVLTNRPVRRARPTARRYSACSIAGRGRPSLLAACRTAAWPMTIVKGGCYPRRARTRATTQPMLEAVGWPRPRRVGDAVQRAELLRLSTVRVTSVGHERTAPS